MIHTFMVMSWYSWKKMEIVCDSDRAMYIIFPHFIFMHALDSYDAELNGETVDVMWGEGMIMTMKLATDEMK